MGFSLSHLLLLLLVILIVFGAGKLPRVMGDIGKGFRHLREGLRGEEETENKKPEHITHKNSDHTPS